MAAPFVGSAAMNLAGMVSSRLILRIVITVTLKANSVQPGYAENLP